MKQKIINKFNYKHILIFGFILFQVITIITALFHEQWFDEAQAWNIAKLSLPEIIERLPYEQHPILWFLVLKLFQTLGLEFNLIWIISLIFTDIAIIFLIKKIDIDNNMKLMIAFFGPLIYYFPVISREYCLMPILFLILAYLHDKKIKYSYLYSITLVLLANTMILVEMFVLCLGIKFIYDLIKNKESKKKIIINFLILTLGALAVLIPVCIGFKYFSNTSYLGFTDALDYIFHFATSIPIVLGIFIISHKILKKLNRENKVVGYLSIIYILFILEFIYGMLHEQKLYIIFLILIYTYIICSKENRTKIHKNFMFAILLSGGLGLVFSFYDVVYNYSDSEYMRDYIEEHKDAIFITNSDDVNVILSVYELENVINSEGEQQNIIYQHQRGKVESPVEYSDFEKNIINKYDCDVYLLYRETENIENIDFSDFEIIYYDLLTINEKISLLKYKK